jgi:hypothetical protein
MRNVLWRLIVLSYKSYNLEKSEVSTALFSAYWQVWGPETRQPALHTGRPDVVRGGNVCMFALW